ncbi:MAG: DinB family protein [Flavobacterium sp.]|nr:DinB family protein [Flavobacterium sp.]
MNIQNLIALFDRDLKKLSVEIESYKSENKIWVIDKGINNSAGNLCLHLIGNLNTYVGLALGKTAYVRNRELEFSSKNIPKTVLLSQIEATRKLVQASLSGIEISDLEQEFPMLVFEKSTSTGYMLIHLTTHLAYHLGQINYHRRLLD